MLHLQLQGEKRRKPSFELETIASKPNITAMVISLNHSSQMLSYSENGKFLMPEPLLSKIDKFKSKERTGSVHSFILSIDSSLNFGIG